MTRHTNKRYILFGADGGIGSATAKLLHEAGAKLMLVGGPNQAKLNSLSQQLAGASSLSIDATSSAKVKEAFDKATQALGGVDGVVHCIGSFDLEPIERTTDDAIDAVIGLNLSTAIYIAREIAQRFKHHKGMSAVFVTSAAAQRGMPSQEILSAAKGGVEALVRSLASTMAPHIRVNGVAPGLIATPLTENLRSEPGAADKSKGMFAAQRFGNTEQVADTIAFLLDAEHTFVTGQVWAVDGGLTHVQVKPHERIDAGQAKPGSQAHGGSEAARETIASQTRFAEKTATE